MKFEKPSLGTWFFIAGIIFLLFIQSKNLDPSTPILVVSGILLTFPVILLSVFAVLSIRSTIREYYKIKRDEINRDILGMRKKQETISDIGELIELDREIMTKREELKGLQSNRFEKCSIYAILLFVITIFIVYLDFGLYVGISSRILGVIGFLWGSYYLSEMIKVLFIAFKRS